MARNRPAEPPLVRFVTPRLRTITPIVWGIFALLFLAQALSPTHEGLGVRVGVWIFDSAMIGFCLFTAYRGFIGVGVFATRSQLVIRTLRRTHRFDVRDIDVVSAETGATGLYVRTYLVVSFKNGTQKRFRDVNSPP